MFVSGFLALASACSPGACIEQVGGVYARQPISFSEPVRGRSVSTVPYTFGNPAISGPIAGRAIFDAPVGGNLLLVMPRATPPYVGGPVDEGEAGFLSLIFTALQAYPDAAAFSGSFAAGAVLGTCYDQNEVLGPSGMVVGVSGNYGPAAIASSPMTAGVALTIRRGLLAATSAWTA